MTAASLKGRNILVVEDDYMIARQLRDGLEQCGVNVVGPAPSVRKALALLESMAIDAAVLDVNLGEERSFPIAQILEARGVPFLFATGYNSADIPDEWQHAVIVTKPLRISKIEELLSPAGVAEVSH